MTDPGLDRRLRQRSRRAGFMIGITMAVTIALCVAGFSVIYAALDDTIGDFVSRDVPAPIVPTSSATAETSVTQNQPAAQSTAEAQPGNAQAEAAATTGATETSGDEFTPDYRSSNDARLNFRTEPSTAGGQATVQFGIPEGTLLQFTGETSPSNDPNDGEDGWMLFKLEDGTEGWLRAIDVTKTEP